MIIDKAKKINDEGRRFVVYTTCESFMEFVIAADHDVNMYGVDNNSNQIKTYFTNNDPDLIAHSRLYNVFTAEERELMSKTNSAFFFHNFGFYSAEFYILP